MVTSSYCPYRGPVCGSQYLYLQLKVIQHTLWASGAPCPHMHMPTNRHKCIHITKIQILNEERKQRKQNDSTQPPTWINHGWRYCPQVVCSVPGSASLYHRWLSLVRETGLNSHLFNSECLQCLEDAGLGAAPCAGVKDTVLVFKQSYKQQERKERPGHSSLAM